MKTIAPELRIVWLDYLAIGESLTVLIAVIAATMICATIATKTL